MSNYFKALSLCTDDSCQAVPKCQPGRYKSISKGDELFYDCLAELSSARGGSKKRSRYRSKLKKRSRRRSKLKKRSRRRSKLKKRSRRRSKLKKRHS